jgi:hypothetical protein
MWTRHSCTYCNGTGKLNRREECHCLVLPDYLSIFPDAEWQKTNDGRMILVYAVSGYGSVIITDESDVSISTLGHLNEGMVPRSVEELNELCKALKLEILY